MRQFIITTFQGDKPIQTVYRKRVDYAELAALIAVYDSAKRESLLDRQIAHNAIREMKSLFRAQSAYGFVTIGAYKVTLTANWR